MTIPGPQGVRYNHSWLYSVHPQGVRYNHSWLYSVHALIEGLKIEVGANLVSHLPGSARHFLIPWTGGAFAPLGSYCPKASWVNEFNIEKKFKKQNFLVSILKLQLCLNV
jgi:hypothetical protein